MLRPGIKAVIRRFVMHPVKGRDQTSNGKSQSEYTGQRLRTVFLQIAESDFQIMCKHGYKFELDFANVGIKSVRKWLK